MTKALRVLTALGCGLILGAGVAMAQPSERDAAPVEAADLAALRDEVSRLREEVAALRSALADVRRTSELTPVNAVQPTAPATQPTPPAVDLLKAQVEELAQVKVESASRFPVKFSGTILTNTFVNSGEANWLENPNIVSAAPSTGPTGSMSATARQSRIGFEVSGIDAGGWQASGTLIADFFGGVPNFQNGTVMGLPRLIYAFGRLQHERTAIEVGQNHVILAPRDPTSLASLSFPLLFRAGNLYLRAPQARLEQTIPGGWTLAAGIVAPAAGDFSGVYEFAPAAGAGERAKRPAVQARLGFDRGSEESSREISAGASGHYGWRRVGTTLVDSWAFAVDYNARVGRIGTAGEYYTGENAEVFGGGISQPGRASGGWIEGRFDVTTRATAVGGVGIDRPADAVGRVLRTENRSVFSSVIFDVTPEVAASLEYRWLRTRAGAVPVSRENHHVNAVLAVRF